MSSITTGSTHRKQSGLCLAPDWLNPNIKTTTTRCDELISKYSEFMPLGPFLTVLWPGLMPAHVGIMRRRDFNLPLCHFSHSLKHSERLALLAVANEGKAAAVLLLFGLARAVFVFHAARTRPFAGTRRDSVGIRCWYQVAVWLSTLAALGFNPRRRKQVDAPLTSFSDEFWVERMTLP